MSESAEVGVVSHCLVEGLVWPTNGSDEVLAVAGGLQPVDGQTVKQAVYRGRKNRVILNSYQDLNSSTQHWAAFKVLQSFILRLKSFNFLLCNRDISLR